MTKKMYNVRGVFYLINTLRGRQQVWRYNPRDPARWEVTELKHTFLPPKYLVANNVRFI